MDRALQDMYAPSARCFGCGPANDKGLRIKSHPLGDGHVICDFTPEPHHAAFDGVLNGGIIGTLLDCHMNWTFIARLIEERKLDHAPACVTAEFSVQLRRPTPMGPLHIDGHVVSLDGDRGTIEATMTANGKVTAIGKGVFVSVKPDHPAYHRW